ncbi:ATP-grasp domain-containing protein [Geosporobacter ferrireducens]|uniref:ATP-grasp domain-containing protein n=1 Tax=Geosporobacter ferrireducens TaxID=1424294 RepID=UPI00139E79A9|nr:ATP-grasp domain-containing protein [Geosporobacter ferrireducens]MTI56522.1 ATP-grasp domain-containing protein [Geosporobacter ferrireducens]
MKILVLGGSNIQLNVIQRAKEKGHTVIVSDFYPHAPGKAYGDYSENVSTFDIDGNIQVAKKYGIDGVLTIGTDQPVYTAAKVAEALNLPSPIDAKTAKAVTNKKVMKQIFAQNKIPTVAFALLKKDFADSDLYSFQFPVVIKPLDSQGQRGVYKLDSMNDIRNLFDDVLSFSREEEILLERFYPSDEITVSGWVINGETYVFSIVDRLTFNNYPHIGVCIGHHFPSKYMKKYYDEILSITKNIVSAFQIKNGPIYFQMLIGEEGIKVNEIACRIGGAYEDEYVPQIIGIDLLDMLIDSALGKAIDPTSLKHFDLYSTDKHVSVEMFFAKTCIIKALTDMEKIKKLPGVLQAKHNFQIGTEIKEIANATQRAGYMIIQGKSAVDLSSNIKRAYDQLGIYDEAGNNMLIRFNGK